MDKNKTSTTNDVPDLQLGKSHGGKGRWIVAAIIVIALIAGIGLVLLFVSANVKKVSGFVASVPYAQKV